MGTQPEEIPWIMEQIREHIVGGTITEAITNGPDDEHEESFGFTVLKNGKRIAVWVMTDAEGNGPGWLSYKDWYEWQGAASAAKRKLRDECIQEEIEADAYGPEIYS